MQQVLGTDATPDAETPKRRIRRLRWVLVGVLAALAVAYAGTAWAVAGRVPGGVSVDGVDVGGLGRARAVTAVEDGLSSRAAEPVPVTVGDVTDEIDPGAAGLTLDVAGTVDDLVGFSLDPRDLWRHVSGGNEVEARVRADDAALQAAVTDLAARVDAAPVEGAVTFTDGVAVPTVAAAGREVDVEGAAGALQDGWWSEPPPLELPADITEPEIGQEAVDTALASFAVPATAGPLVVTVGEASVELPPAVVAPTLSMAPTDGALVPAVDGEALLAAVLAADGDVVTKPTDATVRLADGGPVVVPAKNGLTIDPAALAPAALTALATPERVAVVEAVVAEPEVTTAEVEALGVKEVISEFATNLTANPPRTENIQIAAREVNNTLLLPGETFSLNETLGERTRAKGYNEAGVIVDGRSSEAVGGGVSQMATTLFNAMFFAGLQDVEHKPHSFYISRYPEGREATVNYGSIDLAFKNDSTYGVLIETFVSGGQVHARFWGTKVWDITSDKSPRRNVTAPETITDTGDDCSGQSPSEGFDISVTRTFSRGGSVERTEEFNTRYNPADHIICG